MIAPLANVNGEAMPLADVKVSALDRGFLFGDAVYEVIRIYQGKPWLMEDHMRRLAQSLRAIRIEGIDLHRLGQRVHATIAAGPFAEATVYIQITRGAAPRSHGFPKSTVPLEFLFVQELQDPYTEYRQKGASVITRPDIRWDHCDIKSTNLLANVLAAQDAKEAGCLETLFYRPNGVLTEGTHTSFFGVLDGAVLTAPNSTAILPGITRSLILRLCDRSSIPVREEMLKRDDLSLVSELFLTGTTTEVMPVIRVDGQPIGTGEPGTITRRLQQAYCDAVAEFVKRP